VSLHLSVEEIHKVIYSLVFRANDSCRPFSRLLAFSILDNPPAKDGISLDSCERIIISLLLENVLATNPIWNAYE